MNEEQLRRALQSVGKSCFVRFFGEFSSSSIAREDVIEKLRLETDYTETSCVTRATHARSIVNAGLAKTALNMVITSESSLVKEDIRVEAQKWLDKLNS